MEKLFGKKPDARDLSWQQREAVIKKWTEYVDECKKNRARATFGKFYDEYSNYIVYRKSDGEECTLEDIAKSCKGVKAIVHNDREQKRQKNKNMSKQYRSKNKKSK